MIFLDFNFEFQGGQNSSPGLKIGGNDRLVESNKSANFQPGKSILTPLKFKNIIEKNQKVSRLSCPPPVWSNYGQILV